MARRAELAGIIKPTVDDRQLEQEAQQMEGRFDKAARLTPSIDTRKIQRQLERIIPGGGILGTVADAVTGGGGGGGRQGGDAIPGGESTIQTAQLEKLDDIHDELEQIGASGGLGGGEGSDGDGGLLASIGGGVIGRKAAGMLGGAAGGSGALSALTGSTAATIGGGALAGSALGLGGVAALDRTGALGAIRGAGQRTRAAIGGQAVDNGLKTANAVTFGGLGSTVQGGASLIDLVRGNGLNGPMSKQASQQFRSRGQLASEAIENLKEPQWLKNLDTEFTAPSWLQGLDTDFTAPNWLNDISTTFEGPNWLKNLDPQLSVPQPDWLDSLDSSLNLDINFPTPKIDLAAGSVQSEVESAFDRFKNDIVDEVVNEVTDRLSTDSPV